MTLDTRHQGGAACGADAEHAATRSWEHRQRALTAATVPWVAVVHKIASWPVERREERELQLE